MPTNTDIVVVGAGIAGLSAASELADHGDVVVLEREPQPATHATGRSAAVICETYGHAALCALAAASRPFLERPPPGFSDVPLVAPRGMLWVADAQHDLSDVITGAERLAIGLHVLDRDQAVAMVGALRPEWIDRAALEPEAKRIDVAALVEGYRANVLRQGGTVRTSTGVHELRRANGRWQVTTTTGETISADVVVNAAGAWADEVARRAGVAPIGLQPLLRTAFIFPVHDHDTGGWPLVMDVGGRFYFEPEGNGLLVSPADETPSEPHDARADPVAMALATDALAEATTLQVRGVRQRWAGLRTFAPDRVPVVGFAPDAPGFFWLAGQGGGGIKTSPAMSTLTAALVAGAALPSELERVGLDVAALRPERFHRSSAVGAR